MLFKIIEQYLLQYSSKSPCKSQEKVLEYPETITTKPSHSFYFSKYQRLQILASRDSCAEIVLSGSIKYSYARSLTLKRLIS